MHTVWGWLADSVVGLHFAFLAYLIVGGFLALALAEVHRSPPARHGVGGVDRRDEGAVPVDRAAEQPSGTGG